MKRRYGLGFPQAGLVALLAALVLALLPSAGFAAGSGDTAGFRPALVPITRDVSPALVRGAGYWTPTAAQRTVAREKRRVAALQRLLTRLGKRPGPVDGLYGPLTEAGVVRFQRAAGVAADGIVGPKTARKLLAAATRQPALQRVERTQGNKQKRTDEVKRSRQPSGIGASVANAAAPGQEEELEPELVLVLALPLLLGSALVGALRGRVTPLRKRATSRSLRRGSEGRAPVRQRAQVTTGHTGGRVRERTEPRERVHAIGYVSSTPGAPPDMRHQMQAISSACEDRGWQLLEIVREAEREGDGPAAATRPGLTHMLGRLESGEASCVIVWDLAQLSPSVTELGTTLRSIGRTGGRFVSLEDKIDTAEAAGRKAANVIVSVSGWEHQRLGERTRRGLAAARANGGSISRPSVQDVPRLKEYIAEMRAEGMTLQAIADTLNEEGVPTLRGGQKWRPSSVQSAAGYRRPKR
jgi:DNA invertase Pin-like site-specific DNA recombinase